MLVNNCKARYKIDYFVIYYHIILALVGQNLGLGNN
jgi:hypothetical protein